MATYPISSGDTANILEAVNYVASGPSGLGQQLQGFSSYTPTNLTGNFRVPFTATGASMYVEPIPLSTAEWLDDYTWKYTFAAAQPSAPFALGNPVRVTGVTPSDYNGYFLRIGVVECTTTYVICREQTPYPNPGVIGTGGQIELNVVDALNLGEGAEISTDANAFLSIDGGNSLVSVTAQVDISPFDYAVLYTDYPTAVPELNIYVLIYRYIAINVGTIPNPQYRFVPDKIVSQELIYNAPLNDYTQGVPVTYNFISGTSDAGSAGIYTSVTATSTSGLGTNAIITLNITAPGTAYSTGSTLLSVGGGGNYQVGDTVTWDGSLLGGVSGVNDLVLEVASIGGTGDITVPQSLTIFTPVIDDPTSGLYWYLLEVNVEPDYYNSLIAVKSISVNRRNLTAQVLKK
jgi:hypothetical protein